jgi:NADH:ubiquinone oxidoreductase subunit 5 (subunit L)/multisubunit Na+/H+ antiporter MnhA subunit
MPFNSHSLEVLLALPFFTLALLAITRWLGRPLSERLTVGLVGLAFGLALVGIFGLDHPEDLPSVAFLALDFVLVGLIAAFSSRYLHREPGFHRFYLLLTLLAIGIEVVVLSPSLDVLIVGWELVGIASTLLIAFFHHRPNPVRHAFRAFITYRVCDVGLISGALWLHHVAGTTAFIRSGDWAGLAAPAGTGATVVAGLLLLFASMGKSAQVPFSGWLPRAMEGPTPSSAIFYGALSIHLGPFLLLRSAPLFAHSPLLSALVVLVGLSTALHATVTGRVQSDIKSALAYASMTQVGLIMAEIGLGFHTFALVHIVGHACLRTLEILRSPSLLHDHHHLEQAMGSVLPRTGWHLERLVPATWQPWLYRYALERGYFDSWLKDGVIGRFVRLVRSIDRLDQAWIGFLSQPPGPRAIDEAGRSLRGTP